MHSRLSVRTLIFVLFAGLLSACAGGTVDTRGAVPINDPYEPTNRAVHAFNKGLDTVVVRPVGRSFSAVVPDEIEDSLGNFASNLDQPGVVVNSLLQGDLKGAGISTVRFLTNSVLGLGGFFDAAAEFQIPEHYADFGQTLAVWGVGEGVYMELPVLGPSTARHTTGRIVDLFTNPLNYVLPNPERTYRTRARIVALASDRGRFSETIDGVLYESADSYAQSRLIYLQNRRFTLGGDDPADFDPYADVTDFDPYEDVFLE